jgi:hypothetical protein
MAAQILIDVSSHGSTGWGRTNPSDDFGFEALAMGWGRDDPRCAGWGS